MVSGCARFPDNPIGLGTKQLVFTMTTDGSLEDGSGGTGLPYVYVIALNLSVEENPTTEGPVPIIVPGGNGIVDGDATHFILWNPQASPQYQIYQFRDGTLNEYFQTGIPILYDTVSPGGRTIRFEVDLSQLVPEAQVNDYRSVQVNFLTMNSIQTSGSGRLWDALGDGRIPSEINTPFTARLGNSQIYTNQNQGTIEPQGDTPAPSLDIVDWSIEVRLQQ